MAITTTPAADRMRLRARVVNGLAEGIGPVIAAIDRLESAAAASNRARVRRAGHELFAARDAYLAPIIERAESGADW